MGLIKRLLSDKIEVPFLDYLNEPMLFLSRNGNILEVNKAFSTLVGLRKTDILGRDCREIEVLASLWNPITSVLFNDVEASKRMHYKERFFDAHITPVKTSDGSTHILITMRDVSRFVSLESELIKRNRELIIANALSGTFINSENLDGIYTDLLDKVSMIADMPMGWFVMKGAGGLIEVKALHGLSHEFRDKIDCGAIDDFMADVMGQDDPLYVISEQDGNMPEFFKHEGIAFLAVLPVKIAGDTAGAVFLMSRQDHAFDLGSASLYSLIGNNLSMIIEKVDVFQETKRLSVTDALTGIYNLRYFYEELEHEVERTKRYKQPFSIMLFDIDNFKAINDKYGHQAGDDVLRSIAEKLSFSARKTDTVARYGGEEFITILLNTDSGEAMVLAKRIKGHVEVPHELLDGTIVNITVSAGVATFPDNAYNGQNLLYAADMAMYEAKASGKNCITQYKGMADRSK